MEISKTELLMLLCDAYTYHTTKAIDRSRKKYKNKTLKYKNNELINYHNNVRFKINELIANIKNNDNIDIINDYN